VKSFMAVAQQYPKRWLCDQVWFELVLHLFPQLR
jgi:hypothetical protein